MAMMRNINFHFINANHYHSGNQFLMAATPCSYSLRKPVRYCFIWPSLSPSPTVLQAPWPWGAWQRWWSQSAMCWYCRCMTVSGNSCAAGSISRAAFAHNMHHIPSLQQLRRREPERPACGASASNAMVQNFFSASPGAIPDQARGPTTLETKDRAPATGPGSTDCCQASWPQSTDLPARSVHPRFPANPSLSALGC